MACLSLEGLTGQIEAIASSAEVKGILCITSFDSYSSLYRNRLVNHLDIQIVNLNHYRNGSGFVEAYAKALRNIGDGYIVVIDDARDFLQQGRIYSPQKFKQAVALLKCYSEIFLILGGKQDYVSELEQVLEN